MRRTGFSLLVVLLLGGGVSWNEGWRNDLWAYHVGANRREKLTPQVVGGKEAPKFQDNMPSAYDERHNAVIFTDGNVQGGVWLQPLSEAMGRRAGGLLPEGLRSGTGPDRQAEPMTGCGGCGACGWNGR